MDCSGGSRPWSASRRIRTARSSSPRRGCGCSRRATRLRESVPAFAVRRARLRAVLVHRPRPRAAVRRGRRRRRRQAPRAARRARLPRPLERRLRRRLARRDRRRAARSPRSGWSRWRGGARRRPLLAALRVRDAGARLPHGADRLVGGARVAAPDLHVPVLRAARRRSASCACGGSRRCSRRSRSSSWSPAELVWAHGRTPLLFDGEPASRSAARAEASAWLARTSRPDDVLFGYDPLFLGAWERNDGFSSTVVPRADPVLALDALARRAAPARPRRLGAGRERHEQLRPAADDRAARPAARARSSRRGASARSSSCGRGGRWARRRGSCRTRRA